MKAEIVDLCLYFEEEKTLVLSDIHLGYEESLKGILLPKHQFKLTIERLEKTLAKLDVKRVVINGDVKHEFGTVNRSEWKETLKLIDYLAPYEVVIVKGNHDVILEPVVKKRGIELVDYFIMDDVLICHGDKIYDFDGVDTIVIGHEHPAILIKDYPRKERYKCFLKGKWNGKELIVMPSYNLIKEGSNILNNKVLSPYLKGIDLDDFRVIVVDKEVYDFGCVGDLVEFYEE